MQQFRLRHEFIELNQLLKLSGLCASGGAGKMLVAAGGVKVDGVEESRKTAKIRAGQVVTLGDVSILVLAAEASNLDRPLAGITAENLRTEADFGAPVGKERL